MPEEKHKTIQEKIIDLQEDRNCVKLKEVRKIAVRLLLSAVKNDEWEDFIEYFVEEKPSEIRTKQLARLKLEDDAADSLYIRRTIAYLLANSMCGCDTRANLNQYIDDRLDVGIKVPTLKDL